MSVTISPQARATLIAAARASLPHEACGLLLGADAHIEVAVPTANVAPDPSRHFEIDPATLIAAHKRAREGGLQVVGYFHSHPNGLAQPSATDAASAAGDGRVWAIVAPLETAADGGAGDGSWAITCWHDGPEGFEPLSYAVLAG